LLPDNRTTQEEEEKSPEPYSYSSPTGDLVDVQSLRLNRLDVHDYGKKRGSIMTAIKDIWANLCPRSEFIVKYCRSIDGNQRYLALLFLATDNYCFLKLLRWRKIGILCGLGLAAWERGDQV
jgi:hypothetical protein